MIDKIKAHIFKIRRYVLGTICLSSVVFIFQACYGPSQNYHDGYVSGIVLSSSETPIANIKISVDSSEYEQEQTYTDTNGRFYLDLRGKMGEYKLKFEDLDSVQNDTNRRNVFYKPKDTIVQRRSNFTVILDKK